MTQAIPLSPNAYRALEKILALRKISSETGVDTSRAKRGILNTLVGHDQAWIAAQLAAIDSEASLPSKDEVE